MKPATARSLGTLCCAALFCGLFAVAAQAELAVPLDGNQTMGNANSATAKQAQAQQKALEQSSATRSAGGTFSKNLNFTTSNTVKGNINAANSAQVNIGGLDLGGSAAASSGGNGQSAVSTAATAAAALINQPSQSNGNTSTSSASVTGNAGKTTAATPSGGTSASNSGQQSQTGSVQQQGTSLSDAKWAELKKNNQTVANINSKYYKKPTNNGINGFPEGQCTWYAKGRFSEVNKVNLQMKGDARDWLNDTNKKNNQNIAEFITCPRGNYDQQKAAIADNSIAVRKTGGCDKAGICHGHVMFVEHVTYDSKGNPDKVYYTESNYDSNNTYNPGVDGIVKEKSFSDFIKNIDGYIVPIK